MSITYKEVIENELLSHEVIECLPSEICKCGGQIVFTDNLNQIYCSNPRCMSKVATRMSNMTKLLGVDGFGLPTCEGICTQFKAITPFILFKVAEKAEQGVQIGLPGLLKKLEDVRQAQKKPIELHELVRLCGVPSVDTISFKIFDGYTSLSEAYEDIESGQLSFIARKLNIKSTEGSVMALKVYNMLIEFKDELLYGESMFNIIKHEDDHRIRVKVAITKAVKGYKNKGKFISDLQERYGDIFNIILIEKVNSDSDVLVSDSGEVSGQYKSATKINEKHLVKLKKEGITNLEEFKANSINKVGESVLITTSIELNERLKEVYEFYTSDN